MTEPVVVPPKPGGLLPGVARTLRKELRRCRAVFRETLGWRERFEDLEAPVREIEAEFEGRSPRGKRLRAVVAESVAAVAGASEVHTRVRDREQEAVERLKGLIRQVRSGQKSDGPDLTDLVETLQRWYRFRCVEIEWLDGELQHSHMLVNLPAETATATELYTLLRRRREYLDRVNTLIGKARKAEAALFGGEGSETAIAAGAPRNEEDEEVVKTKDDGPKRDDDAPPAGNGKQAEKAPKPKDRKAKEAALAPTVDRPFFHLSERIDDLARAAEGARVEVKKILAKAAAQAERDREELEASLAGKLRRAESDLEERTQRLEAAEQEVEALRAARDEARETSEKREKEIADERARLKAETLAANQERDEALVLISSLTRRLGTPGVPEED